MTPKAPVLLLSIAALFAVPSASRADADAGTATKSAAKKAAAPPPATAKSAAAAKKPAPKKKPSPKSAKAPSANAASKSEPPPPAPPVPEPPATPPPAASARSSTGTVRVPSTAYVRVEVPPGLQAWLDADDRMRPWLSKAISALDGCYAEIRADDPSAAGTVVFSVTMHRTARPSADVNSIPQPLQSMLLCATRRLIAVKMPLFTGSEGDRFSVQVRFQP